MVLEVFEDVESISDIFRMNKIAVLTRKWPCLYSRWADLKVLGDSKRPVIILEMSECIQHPQDQTEIGQIGQAIFDLLSE